MAAALEFPTYLRFLWNKTWLYSRKCIYRDVIVALWNCTSIKKVPNCSFLLKWGSAPRNYSFIHHVIKSASSVNDLALKLFSRKADLWQLLFWCRVRWAPCQNWEITSPLMIISLNDCIMSLENMQRSERKASIKSIIKPQGSKFRTARVEEFSEVRLEEQWSTVTSCAPIQFLHRACCSCRVHISWN